MCHHGDRSCAQVAEDLGVSYTTLMTWKKGATSTSEATESGGLSVSEKDELKRLRRENERLRMERDILKRATAFFASQSL
jgi:transposase